jgi:hypothetical protein
MCSPPSFRRMALPLRYAHEAQVLGRQLEALVDRARMLRDKWGDKFVSVEHLVLAYTEDQRFGQTLMRSFALTAEVRRLAASYRTLGVVATEMLWSTTRAFIGQTSVGWDGGAQTLEVAAKEVRGANKVVDQDPEGKYEALSRYARDLTEEARKGKQDPVIGRDDEIRRCIQVPHLSHLTLSGSSALEVHRSFFSAIFPRDVRVSCVSHALGGKAPPSDPFPALHQQHVPFLINGSDWPAFW